MIRVQKNLTKLGENDFLCLQKTLAIVYGPTVAISNLENLAWSEKIFTYLAKTSCYRRSVWSIYHAKFVRRESRISGVTL